MVLRKFESYANFYLMYTLHYTTTSEVGDAEKRSSTPFESDQKKVIRIIITVIVGNKDIHLRRDGEGGCGVTEEGGLIL